MEEKEFIKLIKELQKLQVKVLGKKYLSIDIHLGRANPITYVGFHLFIYDTENNVKELYSKTLYSNSLYSNSLCSDKIKNNNAVVNSRTLNEIKKKVTKSLFLYGGRKRSEAERSDAPIK